VYEVYAVDFAEQGGALHGAFLKLQSEFVATVLQQMIQDCSHNDEIPRITLVAHSMGGYVARLTMQNQPSLRAHVKNIITLATPHQNPLYAFEPTIHELHQQLAQSGQKASQEIIEDQLIVSISGGLRDEMIDPYAGELPSTHAFQSISVQATFLRNNSHNLSSSLSHTQQESFYLGMDHRAIVWCHQLLMDVRKIIWTLATSDHLSGLERRKKIEIALGIESETGIPYSYMENTHQLHQILKLRLGYFQAVCMESSMMYNLPLLYAFYLFNASLRCSIACLQALPHFSEWRHIFGIASLWLTIMLGFVFTNLSFETSTILGLVGNAANVILMRVITVGFLWRRNARDYIERALGFLCLSFVVVVFVLAWCFRSNKGRVSFWSILDPSVYIWSILATYVVLFVWMGLSSFREWRGFQHCMAANFMLTVPTVMAGPIILGWHEQASRVDSWTTLLALQIPLLAMSAFHLHEQKIGSRDNKALEGSQKLTVLKSILIALVVLIASPQVLSRGSGHVLPTMLEIIAWIDIMSSVVESRWVRK
jgi:pimeloyl-ACP methyl ester carboxylesterase